MRGLWVFLHLGVLLCCYRRSVRLCLWSIRSSAASLSTFLFSTVLLSLNLCLSRRFLSSPSSTSPGFIGEGESPSPCLFEVACSYIIVFPCRISSLFLPLRLLLPWSLPLSSPASHLLPLWVWGGGWGGEREYLLTLFLFYTLPPFPYSQWTCSHTHTQMIMLNVCTEELRFTWLRGCLVILMSVLMFNVVWRFRLPELKSLFYSTSLVFLLNLIWLMVTWTLIWTWNIFRFTHFCRKNPVN